MALRSVDTIRCLRAARVFPHVRRALAASSRPDFRIYSGRCRAPRRLKRMHHGARAPLLHVGRRC